MSVSDTNFDIYFTFLPFGSKIIGSPIVLQTLRRIVVLPALACPITRIRNCLNLAQVFWISSAVSWGCDEVDIAKDIVVDVSGSSWVVCGVTVTLDSCLLPKSVSVSINVQQWFTLVFRTHSFFFIPFQPELRIQNGALFTYPFTRVEDWCLQSLLSLVSVWPFCRLPSKVR